MPVSHRYTLSDQLKLWFFVAVSVLYIFMSVYIAERPTFEKLIEVCLQSSYIHFESDCIS